jgi:DNA-binding transcriptional ArsR family regulator
MSEIKREFHHGKWIEVVYMPANHRVEKRTQRVKREPGFLLVPAAWVKALYSLPPPCHAVAYCLLRRQWSKGSNQFRIGNGTLAKVGVTWRTKMRALRLLAEAGLVEIELRGARFTPTVTLLKLQ